MKKTIGNIFHAMRLVGMLLGAGALFVSANGHAQTLQERIDAAETTVTTNEHCTDLKFYWEIGDANGALASGTQGSNPPSATTSMNIASATKWLWGAYLAELRSGQLSADDIKSLHMKLGYVNWVGCRSSQSVGQCHERLFNDNYTASADGFFEYDGADFQKYAAIDLDLYDLKNAGLQQEMQNYLGTNIDFIFDSPSPAGGGRTDAVNYAKFLRKILNGQLEMGSLLGANPTCTYTGQDDPATGRENCATALDSPIPEDWDYSIGHWVETDPVNGDGAFSSAGAWGFYPWIDSTETWYGIVARESTSVDFWSSIECGREIREAWVTGTAQ